MVDKAFLITDMIDGSSVKQKLDKIKEKIKSDYDAKGLIMQKKTMKNII